VHTAFDTPAERADQVIFAAKSLADRLHAGLAAEGLACVRLAATVTFDNGSVQERLWRHEGLLSAAAVAERVRWQLSNWRPGTATEDPGDEPHGGVVRLDLVPDQLVPDTGRQQAIWGDSDITERIERAAERIQAMLGHHAVTRPYLVGGRGPGEQVVRVPVGDLPPQDLPDGPWPGAIPDPQPATVLPQPAPARVTDEYGTDIRLSIRCRTDRPPALLTPSGGPPARVLSWTGPWPARERWWDPAHTRRRARFQLVTTTGTYLVAFENGHWHTEAVYD
jgi:protein ImuB